MAPARLADILEATVAALTTGLEQGHADPATLVDALPAPADHYDRTGRHDAAGTTRRTAADPAEVG